MPARGRRRSPIDIEQHVRLVAVAFIGEHLDIRRRVTLQLLADLRPAHREHPSQQQRSRARAHKQAGTDSRAESRTHDPIAVSGSRIRNKWCVDRGHGRHGA